MPITIPDNLPARKFLVDEGIMVMKRSDAIKQDIRPMQILLLNLMPQKEITETQIARLLGSSPLQVEMTLLTTQSYTPIHVPKSHLNNFYYTFDQIKDKKFDGLILTGAPIEHLPFEDVKYWDELNEILQWAQTHTTAGFNICWGAQAALYHFRKVSKHLRDQKIFGIYQHHATVKASTLLRGFDDVFDVPVSRHTEVLEAELPKNDQLQVLASSDIAGLCLVEDHRYKQTYMFNHLEYDANTLHAEYMRDHKININTKLPEHYFPDNDVAKLPNNRWRAHAHLLISNWLNSLYQKTPYNLDDIGQ